MSEGGDTLLISFVRAVPDGSPIFQPHFLSNYLISVLVKGEWPGPPSWEMDTGIGVGGRVGGEGAP